tara:strand:- start:5 stop:523 length:519 start_codon:yes stop_codon:yes gene_type:complete
MPFQDLENYIGSYPDFPKKGITFKDVLPILANPLIFQELIERMSEQDIFEKAEAIIAIDARGFIFGSAIGFHLSKPVIVARKPGKLPGKLITENYNLEYGKNSLSIQESSLINFNKFVIVDDLLATGGTVNSICKILKTKSKEILGLSVVIELEELKASELFNFKTISQIKF